MSGQVTDQVSEAQIGVPRLLAFIALCVIVGPAIGTLGIFLVIFVGGLLFAGPAQYPGHPFIGAAVVVGYVLGAPVAFLAALIFTAAARQHGRHGLVVANVAAIVAAIVVTAAFLILSEYGYYVPAWRLWRMLGGIGAMALISVVAMTACWLIAWALGIFAIKHETASQTQQI